MRILLISYYFPPSNAVGAKRANSFFNSFIKKGFKVDVISDFHDFDKNKTDINTSSPTITFLKKLKHKISIDLIFRSIDKSLFSKFFISSLIKIINYVIKCFFSYNVYLDFKIYAMNCSKPHPRHHFFEF